MSAPIVNSTPTSADLARADAGARPQLQSRRMSLKLGPLGVTYATDQVLWTDAVAEAAADAAVSAMPGAVASQGAEQAAASQAEARQQAQQAGRSFSQELLEAWRRQVQERAESSATYGPDGARKGVANASGAVEPGEDAGEPRQLADGQEGQADTRTDSPPVARVRRAITAYLSCARQFRQARPMLSAVA